MSLPLHCFVHVPSSSEGARASFSDEAFAEDLACAWKISTDESCALLRGDIPAHASAWAISPVKASGLFMEISEEYYENKIELAKKIYVYSGTDGSFHVEQGARRRQINHWKREAKYKGMEIEAPSSIHGSKGLAVQLGLDLIDLAMTLKAREIKELAVVFAMDREVGPAVEYIKEHDLGLEVWIAMWTGEPPYLVSDNFANGIINHTLSIKDFNMIHDPTNHHANLKQKHAQTSCQFATREDGELNLKEQVWIREIQEAIRHIAIKTDEAVSTKRLKETLQEHYPEHPATKGNLGRWLKKYPDYFVRIGSGYKASVRLTRTGF